MDKQQLNIFKSAFKRANNGKIDMPNRIDIGKIYDVEFYPNGMRNGYKVRFFIAKDEHQKYFIDLLGGDDNSSWHKRIEQNGNILELENYKGQYGKIIYADDLERTEKEHLEIKNYNDNLHKLLIKKCLERNFEDNEFESKNVITIRNYGF